MHPLLDPHKQELAKRYEKEKRLFGLAGSALSLVLLLAFYLTGLGRRLAFLWPDRPFVWAFLVYAAGFLAWLTLLGLPLAYYGGYRHEHKWNFSTQSIKSWLSDQAKSFAVGLVLGSAVLALLLGIMARFPAGWWFVAGAAMALVSVIMATLFPVIILPIFHRYTPIEDKDLTGSLAEILTQEGLKSGGFYQEDMSRRTKKENAFLAGLGRTRRVVLGDNLVRNMSVPEITSIIAHEVGHYRFRHIWKSIGIGTVEQLAVFFLLDKAMRALFHGFPGGVRENLALVPIMAVVGGALAGFLFGPLGNALSRHFEAQADGYVLTHVKDSHAFVTALAGLANRNLANAYPAWWVKILYYSHPPIGERLAAADKIEELRSG